MAATFLALLPPKGLLYKFSAFQREHSAEKLLPMLRFSPWYKLHLTMLYWQKFADNDLLTLENTLRQKNWPPVKSQIQGFHFFAKAQVVFLKEMSAEIISMQAKLSKLLNEQTDFLNQIEDRDFTPHFTIARKFKPNLLKQQPSYFDALDKFTYEANVNRLVAFRTLPGRYHQLFSITLGE